MIEIKFSSCLDVWYHIANFPECKCKASSLESLNRHVHPAGCSSAPYRHTSLYVTQQYVVVIWARARAVGLIDGVITTLTKLFISLGWATLKR